MEAELNKELEELRKILESKEAKYLATEQQNQLLDLTVESLRDNLKEARQETLSLEDENLKLKQIIRKYQELEKENANLKREKNSSEWGRNAVEDSSESESDQDDSNSQLFETDPAVYYISPTGQRLGSMLEVIRYLNVTENKVLSKENFTFVKERISNSDKEIVRLAKNYVSNPEESDSLFVDPYIELPEGDRWRIKVTHVRNSSNVFFRFLDDSAQFDDMSARMQAYYKSGNFAISDIVLGCYYAAPLYDEITWYRVKVTSFEDIYSNCYYLDDGLKTDVQVSRLRVLPYKFLDIPFQAISCQLSGLEFLADDSTFSEELFDRLFGRIFVGEVKRRDSPLSLILHDLSTDENVNETLLNYALR